MKRSIVAIRKNNVTIVPKFSECLLDYFGKDVNSAFVNYSISNGTLVLKNDENGHELKHSPECPIKKGSVSNYYNKTLSTVEDNISTTSNIRVAASVIVESSDSHILLTKRTPFMRSSPNVWVTPGGHIDVDETIYEAGIREVKEETGLDIKNENMTVLGLWENVYPLLLGLGSPKHHILVVYIYTYLNETYERLTQKIIPDPEEISSYCWINYSTLASLFKFEHMNIPYGKQYIIKQNQLVEENLDYTSMFNMWLWTQPQPYSGVNYALKKWMQKKSNNDSVSKY